MTGFDRSKEFDQEWGRQQWIGLTSWVIVIAIVVMVAFGSK